MGLTGTVIRRKAHSQGQAEQREHPRKGQQYRPKESAKIALPPSIKQERPTATAALPGQAIISLLKDIGCQTDSAGLLKDIGCQMDSAGLLKDIRCQMDSAGLLKHIGCQTDTAGLRVTDMKASSQRLRAALAIISKLHLSQATFRKLSMHTARKCLEVKLKSFPAAVRKSMQQQYVSQMVPTYFRCRQALFLSEEKREGLELHIRSMKLERLGNRLVSGSPLKPAASQEEESTSTYVTAPSEASGAEAGPRGHKKCPSRGKSTRSAKAEHSSFWLVRRTFRGVQQTTTTYRSSLLNACGDPDCDPVAAASSKMVWRKICPIPEMPWISVSKHVHLACKGRIIER